ncbi:MAG: PAS domain-containing protein [Candidatus Rokubacteria bacterium]|nr:PAS domain-containing protein [Candidatus Rokubacteria bacterium]
MIEPAPLPPPVLPSAESRLALAEDLLRTQDPVECAQHALEWLRAAADIRQALVALSDAEGTRLSGTAGLAMPASRVRGFSVALDDREHPLVKTLEAGEARVLTPEASIDRARGALPFGRFPCLAVPLVAEDPSDPDAVGLLLVAPVTPPAGPATRWLAGVLSARLSALARIRRLVDTERRLRRDRGLLHSIINAVPDPITLTDDEGRIVIANARAEFLLASRDDDSEGRRRAVALNNMLFSSALWRRGWEGSEPSRHELPLVDPSDGSAMLFELISAPAGDPDAGAGVVSILRNVTDLRRATEEIEENYRRLRVAEADVRAERDRLDLIIDSVADPILVADPGGTIILMNAPAERLFTIPADAEAEVAQRVRANDAHFSSFVANLYLAVDELRWRGDIGLVDPVTAAPLPVEAVSGKLVSERGELIAIATILHDRTEEMEKARLYAELKRASEQLQQRVHEATSELVRQNELLRRQHIELEQASALKTQFLANMSHEFRTPLNAILGYTSMLLQGVSGSMLPPQRKNLDRVESNARHLLAIINDILDIARIEAGKMPLHPGEFRVPELVKEVVAEVEPLIARSGLTVTTELDPRVGEARSDRQKVKQIVLNLLTNALKFTPVGSVCVSARCVAAGDAVEIAVRDTGIGISPEDQERVFEDFRQADNSPTRQYGGAGLGLAICRRLATMLGGQMTLTSALGQGSTFTLLFPRRARRRS